MPLFLPEIRTGCKTENVSPVFGEYLKLTATQSKNSVLEASNRRLYSIGVFCSPGFRLRNAMESLDLLLSKIIYKYSSCAILFANFYKNARRYFNGSD